MPTISENMLQLSLCEHISRIAFMPVDWNYVMNSEKCHFKFREEDSAKRRSRNSVGRYVDRTSLLSGFAKVLER